MCYIVVNGKGYLMSKQPISAFILSLLLAVLLAACQGGGEGDNDDDDEGGEEDGRYQTLVLM